MVQEHSDPDIQKDIDDDCHCMKARLIYLLLSLSCIVFMVPLLMVAVRYEGYRNNLFWIQVGSYMVLLMVWYYRKKIDYRMTTVAYVALLYLSAISGFYFWGLLANADILYMMIIFLLALIFGLRAGIFASLVVVLTHLFFAFAYTQNWIPYSFDVYEYATDIRAWLVSGSVVVFIAFVFIGPVLFFYRELIGQIKALKQSNKALVGEIERRKKAEKNLKEAQHMGNLGSLSEGIAHDFNNMLTPILGYALLVQKEMDREDSLREEMDHIVNAARRAKDLVKQILTYSQKKEEVKEVIAWDELIEEEGLAEVADVTDSLALPAKVLLVDDEELILNYQQSILKGLGVDTVTYKTPEKALAFFGLDSAAYDLAIVDLVMPDMDGYMLSKELHKLNPDLAIVLCSGAFSGADTDTLTSYDIDALLEKPFDELTLRQTLDQAIRVRKKKIE